jgi:predicted proteasome-type protease
MANIHLIVGEKGGFGKSLVARCDYGDACCTALSREWNEGAQQVLRQMPALDW